MNRESADVAINVLLAVDSLADQFESSWRSGGEPQIEEWLGKATPVIRPALLRELLAVELEFRVRRQETLAVEPYLRRFPNWKSIVKEAIAPWREQSISISEPQILPQAIPDKGLEPAAPSPAQTRTVGKFRIHERLGRGGFAAVFRAYDMTLGRWVALKVPHGSTDAEWRRRFLTEARAAAKLRHRNVVTVYESGTADGTDYIACELVDGCDLAKRVQRDRPGLRQLVIWVLDAARGLAHAHSEGVIHRDIKPGNLLAASDGRVVVSDFGLARRVDDKSSMTVDGTVFGTPVYMSPEQASGRTRDVGAQSDQYSLGVVLYEFLAGRPPFSGTIPQVLQHILHHDPPSPRALNPKIPADLEAVCLKAMAHDARDRYSNMTTFAVDLERWLAGESVSARPLRWTQRLWRRAQRSPKTASAISLAAASLAIALLAGWWGSRQGERADTATHRATSAESTVKTHVKTIEQQQSQLTSARIEVQSAVTEADRNRYRALIRQIAEILREGHAEPLAVRALLEKCPVALRDWEWHHFDRIVRPPTKTLLNSESVLCSAALNAKDGQLALCDQAGRVRIVDLSSASIVRTWETRVPAAVQIDWHLPTQRIVAGGKATGLRLWNAATGRAEAAFIDTTQVFSGTYGSPFGGATPNVLQPEKPSIKKRDTASSPANPGTPNVTTRAYFGAENVPDVPPQGHWESQALLAGSSIGWSSAFDPSGQRVAVGTSQPAGNGLFEVHIWNVQSGQREQVLRLDGQGSQMLPRPGRGFGSTFQNKFAVVSMLSFSPDGNRLAAGTSSGSLRIWNCADWSISKTMTMQGPVTALAWSPKEDVVFVPRGERHVTCRLPVKDTNKTRSDSFAISAHSGGVTALAVSHDATWLATGGQDRFIRLWHLPTRRLRDEFYAHAGAPFWIRFTPDGRQLISCSSREALLWTPVGLTLPDTTENSPPIYGGAVGEIAISQNARIVATREMSGFSEPDRLVIRSVLTERPAPEVRLPFNSNFSLADLQFDPRDRWLAAATNGLVEVWDVGTWRPIRWRVSADDVRILDPRAERVAPEGRTNERVGSRGTCLAFNGDGSQFAFGEQTGHLGIVSTGNWKLQKLLHFDEKFQDAPESLAFCPGKPLIAVGWRRNHLVRLVELSGNYGIHELNTRGSEADEATPVGVLSLTFDPSGEFLVTATTDAAIRVWNLKSGALVHELLGHTMPAGQLLFHPQARRLFSRGADRTIRVWDPDTGLEIVTLYSGSSEESLGRMFLTEGGLTLTVVINKQIHSFFTDPPDAQSINQSPDRRSVSP